MNQTTNKTKSYFKDLIICLLFSLFSLAVFFFLLSYAFFKTPDFDDYLVFFPLLLLFFEGIAIVLFSRRFSDRAIFFTMISASCISVFSMACGCFFEGFSSNFPKILVMNLVFVLTCVVIQVFVNKKKRKKRKRLPFKM